MKRWGMIGLVAVMLFAQPAVSLADARVTSAVPSTGQMAASSPPVAQPLVPEGVFAVGLVKALKMGLAQNEAEAETMLSAAGIEPRNGWIAHYPVTPDIIGEVKEAVVAAADAKKLTMGKTQAQKTMEDLVAQLGLNVVPGPPPPSAIAASRGRPGNSTIYKYVDKSGVVHFTDQYESIPREYWDRIETIRGEPHPEIATDVTGEDTEMQPPGPSPADDSTASNYQAGPPPTVINNYYYENGPPVVTYYAPPQPYYYMYAWVPYPFWYFRVFFPGFFILHDFHRTVTVHAQVVVVSNHVVHAGTKTMFIIDPVARKYGGRAGGTRVSSPQLFYSPPAQAGARVIVSRSQQRPQSVKGPAGSGGKAVMPPISPGGAQQQVRSNPGVNPPMAKPSPVNRGMSPNPAGNGSSVMAAKPVLRPSTGQGRNEASVQKTNPGEVRTFSQPVQTSNRPPNSRPFVEPKGSQPLNPAVASRPPVSREGNSSGPGNIQGQKGANQQRSTAEGSRTFQPSVPPSGKSLSSPPTVSQNSTPPNSPAVMSGPLATRAEPALPGNMGDRSFSTSQNRATPAPAARGNGSFPGGWGNSGGFTGRSFSRSN